eukprot:1815779-Amphidinium_carterae.1
MVTQGGSSSGKTVRTQVHTKASHVRKVGCLDTSTRRRGRRLDVKWIDTDKGGGDATKRKLQSRLVCRDIKARKSTAELSALPTIWTHSSRPRSLRMLPCVVQACAAAFTIA